MYPILQEKGMKLHSTTSQSDLTISSSQWESVSWWVNEGMLIRVSSLR